ncbi:glycoside hydrolase family 79 protein [Pluteus cervinus]|uniref:Glycoside hydrolase family 79 protein n=1 Tax=Pluteus cervinus TaxID=181527 RepID=A0ACD3AZD6_9AGAR|nr:glycoside hydrolase family 79 protein [Pluteus cervinus]
MLTTPRKLVYCILVTLRYAQAIGVSVPFIAPANAPRVSGSLISLSLEQDRWTDWVGTTSKNDFFLNTLDNLLQLTGEPTQIRIGANSEDHTNFNPAIQFSQTTFPAVTSTVPYPEATNITVGNGYYQAVQFLPNGTHVIWGVNFGANNITAAFMETRAILQAFSSPAVRNAGIILDALEIGNEADLYPNNGLRVKGFSLAEYIQEWTTFASNVSATASISRTSHTKFWAGSFAGSSHSTSGFSPQALFSNGLLSSASGPLISTFSQHHYSGSFCSGSGGLLQDLMTKATIRSNLTIYAPDIIETRAKGLDYLLGETNSYSCHGAPGVSNTAGAALWTLDYALFAAQLNISRVYFHDGVGFKYNLIQPVTLTRSILDGSTLATPLAAHVQPQYYAAIIAGEAIGNSGTTQIAELSISNARLAGYAFFEHSRLARIILINSDAFFQGATSRPAIHVDFSFVGGTPDSQITVKRLNVGHADDVTGLKWGGQTYETPDGRVAGDLSVQTSTVAAGVDIQSTEVVMILFT